MPNTVLACPWMRPEDQVPYVAPPELFRDDSPCPLPPPSNKTTVPIHWVSDCIQTKTPTKTADKKEELASSYAHTTPPIPSILSPVPVKASPPSPVLIKIGVDTSCGAHFDNTSNNDGETGRSFLTISPTDSTRIGEWQLEEERVVASATVDASTSTASSSSKALWPSVESAFQSVASVSPAPPAACSYSPPAPSMTNGTSNRCIFMETAETATDEAATVVTPAKQVACIAPPPATPAVDLNVTVVSYDTSASDPCAAGNVSQCIFEEQVSADDVTIKADNDSSRSKESSLSSEPNSPGAKSTTSSRSSSSRSSSSSKSKSRLLVLVDMKSSSSSAVANQLYMFTIFSCSRILYDKVDVSDPMQAVLRQELSELSEGSTQYPQFFLQHDDGSVSYWGNWDRFFETAGDSRRLLRALDHPETCAAK